MANLEITEFAGQAHNDNGGAIPAPKEPRIAHTVIANPLASTTQALDAGTRLVKLEAEGGAIRFTIGAAPAADGTSEFLADGGSVYRSVERGHGLLVAVINAV